MESTAAAEKAGLGSVPCWVRELSDEDAYMALALNNAQGELHPLEEGMHALGSGLSVRSYADKAGKLPANIQKRMQAAKVAKACIDIDTTNVRDAWSALSEIHPTPEWLWPALVSRLVADSWTVETARREAQKLKDVAEPPEWADTARIAAALVAGEMKAGDVMRISATMLRS